MATKEQVVFDSDRKNWQIQFKNAKGDTQTRDTVPAVSVLDEGSAVKVFQGYAKDESNRRRAAMSLLVLILEFGGKTLEAYKGQVGPKAALPDELKKSMADAEAGFFKRFMDDKHKDHKSFVGGLPKENARGEALEVAGKLNAERQFQYFLTSLRSAPSYANAKSIVLQYWAYCGQAPIDANGDLTPPEAIRVMVNNVKIVEANDTSFKGRLMALYREVVVEGVNPADDDMPTIVKTLTELADHMQTLATAAANRAAARPKPGDVVQATKDALESAAGQRKAGAPGANVVKAQEPATA